MSWSDVPSALEYRVFRNDADGRGGDVPVGVVAAPTLELFDTNVTESRDGSTR